MHVHVCSCARSHTRSPQVLEPWLSIAGLAGLSISVQRADMSAANIGRAYATGRPNAPLGAAPAGGPAAKVAREIVVVRHPASVHV